MQQSSPYPCREDCALKLHTRADALEEETRQTQLVEELREWLSSLGWTFFITVTFRQPREMHQSMSALNSVHKALSPWKPRLVFLGTEQHVSRLMHIHGLFSSGLIHPNTWIMWQRLFERFGRSKVEWVRSQEDVTAYCTKYVTKKLTDYNIW